MCVRAAGIRWWADGGNKVVEGGESNSADGRPRESGVELLKRLLDSLCFSLDLGNLPSVGCV